MIDFLKELFNQYSQYDKLDIYFEVIAVIFGFLSVWYSKNNNILVFPTGMISTSIFVYLLFKWSLLGDMMINAYYFIMSIYGWFYWSRGNNEKPAPISVINTYDKKIIAILLLSSSIFVSLVYTLFEKWDSFVSYVDIFTTAIFFAAMWLMAKRKIESWIFWIIGDLITVPLYFYKGLTISSIQYIIFLILAVLGYISWKKILDKNYQKLKK